MEPNAGHHGDPVAVNRTPARPGQVPGPVPGQVPGQEPNPWHQAPVGAGAGGQPPAQNPAQAPVQAPAHTARPGVPVRRQPIRATFTPPPESDAVVNRVDLRSALRRNKSDKPAFGRERKIAGDLPDWSPEPPSEIAVDRTAMKSGWEVGDR